jgi:hypothetical protein
MNIFLVILQAIPAILSLILKVEQVYGEAKKGEVKKETVMNGVNVALETAYACGAPMTIAEKDAVKQGLSSVVDGTVGIFNAYRWPVYRDPTDKP